MGLPAVLSKFAFMRRVRARLHLQQQSAVRVWSDRGMTRIRPGYTSEWQASGWGCCLRLQGTLPFAPVHLLLWLFLTLHRTNKPAARTAGKTPTLLNSWRHTHGMVLCLMCYTPKF